MISEPQADHLMICYCTNQGYLSLFPCFNGPGKNNWIQWNLAYEEEISWTYLPIGKHQISNPDSPRHVTIRKKGFMGQRSKIVQLSGIGYFETLDQSGRHLLRRYLWTYSPDRSSREGGGAGSLRILGNFKMNKKKFIMETRCMRLYHETIWILTGLPFFMSTRWGKSPLRFKACPS